MGVMSEEEKSEPDEGVVVPELGPVERAARELGVTESHAKELDVLARVLTVLDGLCCDYKRRAVVTILARSFDLGAPPRGEEQP